MRIFQTNAVEKIKPHMSVIFVSENRSVYERILKNIVEPNRPQITT
jgi:hypothetical protein